MTRLRELLDRAADLRMRAITSGLLRLTELEIIIDPKVHDTPRHFAMCSERADEIRVAPELASQPSPIVDGILMHELGHAADFAYPAWFSPIRGRRVLSLHQSQAPSRAELRAWRRRPPYLVENDADRLAEALFGVRIGYVGELMLQSTEGGIRPRPFGI